uniref:O-acyltransferase n=2 Tax=Photinus pyralis TaxID=7054 RepID=A0A1Y1N943_PHOPY
MVIWLCMFASSLMVYFIFTLWVRGRRKIEWKGTWDRLFGLVYGLYVLVSLHLVAIWAVMNNLGPATCLAIMLEMTRLLMKSHAFVRSNSPKFLENKQGAFPSVSHYLYFLFAPTLIYSDSYPRTNRIRWGRVVTSFAEVIAIVFMWSVIVENTYVDYLKDYGKTNYTFLEIITFIVECNFAGFIMFILLFYLCHSYFNGTAELTRFSDRLFYLDWWTAENWDEFLRKWSYFVHEWLHIYIYRDLHGVLFPGRTLLAKVLVLLLSGYFHDLILCVASRAFLPLTTIEFLCFVWIRKLVSNKFMLGLLGMEMSCTITLFMMEYYARINCPMQTASIIGYVMPRFLYC